VNARLLVPSGTSVKLDCINRISLSPFTHSLTHSSTSGNMKATLSIETKRMATANTHKSKDEPKEGRERRPNEVIKNIKWFPQLLK